MIESVPGAPCVWINSVRLYLAVPVACDFDNVFDGVPVAVVSDDETFCECPVFAVCALVLTSVSTFLVCWAILEWCAFVFVN